jgi:Spy/CpxP family protein refolding chaperone
MSLTPEQRDAVLNELKRIGGQLNLSEDQKERLHGFMAEASEKVHQYKLQNPNASPADVIKKVSENRAAIRQRIVSFLTPDQLSKWDSEVAKAREFLGQKLAA